MRPTLSGGLRGPILEYYVPKGRTVAYRTCSELLRNHLRPADPIRTTRPTGSRDSLAASQRRASYSSWNYGNNPRRSP